MPQRSAALDQAHGEAPHRHRGRMRVRLRDEWSKRSVSPRHSSMWIRGKSLYTNRKVRRERDSNPRGLGGPCGFQERRLTCYLVSLGVVLIRITTRLW